MHFSSLLWDSGIFKQFRNPNASVCVVVGGFFGGEGGYETVSASLIEDVKLG
jgi:hypothetical protein